MFAITNASEHRTLKTIKAFKVEPLTRYKLSFDATGNIASWELRIFNNKGLLPYEGVFAYDWQKIIPERKNYTHSFLTPRDGVLLKFIINGNKATPQISSIKLEQITDENPVINNDFAAGLGNYSGWNDHKRAKLVKNEKGKIVLKCEPTGYALTDPIPVESGATYRYTKGSYTGRILVYDYDLLRVDIIDDYHYKQNPFLKMPKDATYIRIEYCDGRTYRKGAVPVIDKVGIELVKKGNSNPKKNFPSYPGEIILKMNSPLPVVRAAREIQHWTREISGKEMRVLMEPSQKKNLKIYVGKKWAQNIFPKDIKYLEGSDGFAVRRKEDNIYIFGAKPAGALFGAIRFLEKNSDLIFARPRKEFGTIYSKNANLVFKNSNFILRPAFVYRMSGEPYGSRSDDGIWHGRVGLNTSSYFYNQFRREEEGGAPSFNSNYMSVINQSPKYSFEIVKKKYPKLFAKVNGKRTFSPHSYVCPSHPDVGKALAAGLCAKIKKAKANGDELEFLAVRVKDGWTVCSCKKCMKPIKLPNGKLLKPKGETARIDPLFFATRKAIMLNKMADEFAKTYPDRSINIEAYIYTTEPPAIQYKPSLIPMFCAYDTSSLRFPILDGKNNHFAVERLWERRFKEFLRRNKANNTKLSMFTYYYTPGFTAVADSAAADWVALLNSGGVHGIHLDSFTPDSENYRRRDQYQHMWDYSAIERWIIMRLMWDPTLNPQKLREYYIKRTFGKAAPEILNFHNIIRKEWKNPKIKHGVNCHSRRADLFETFILKTGNEKKLRSLLVKAEKKAQNPKSKILIQRMLTSFDRFKKLLNLIYIPYVQESTAEWNNPDSSFWVQALKLGKFKRIATWEDFKQTPAIHPTEVYLMRDKEHLYFRFDALKAKENDTVELVLEATRHSIKYYFSLSRSGKKLALKCTSFGGNFLSCDNTGWDGAIENKKDAYAAIFKIPLATIKGLKLDEAEFKIFAKFLRVVVTEKDSFKSSMSGVDITMSHYMNYWKALSIKKGNN